MNFCRIFIISLFILAIPAAQAADIQGLYEAQVPVKTQVQAERFQVYPDAMAQVIIKISGDTTAPERPLLAATVKGARRLVQQYSYVELVEGESPALAEQGYTHKLVVQFDGESLTNKLVEAGVPLWGRTRPEVLVLLAIEDREVRYVLAANASAEMESYVDDAAQRRGLPTLLPLMDLEDQRYFSFADIWGGFYSSIQPVVERYGADAVLIGRLFRENNGIWQARWSLFDGKDRTHWTTQADTQRLVVDSGIDGAADLIALRFAEVFSVDTNSTISIGVSGVVDLTAYASVLDYLQALDGVSGVRVKEVKGTDMLFDIALLTSRESLSRDIALGTTLLPLDDTELGIGQAIPNKLVYRLQP